MGAGVAYASKAADQPLGQPGGTPDVLQTPHRQLVQEQLQQAGTYLLVEDTTPLRWSWSARPRPGLGPVAANKQGEQGALLHSLVAARWPGGPAELVTPRPAVALLGLLDQQDYGRRPVPEAERTHPHGGTRPRQGRGRESGRWTQRLRHVNTPPPGSRWVVVADRGADIDEHLLACQQRGLGFVVRAAQDRNGVGTSQTLFTVARALPSAGQFTLAIRSRPDRAARHATRQLQPAAGPARATAPRGQPPEGTAGHRQRSARVGRWRRPGRAAALR